jgi:hypothetical protein
MKPGRFLVPSSEAFSAKKLILKKLFATVLATVALSTATLNAAGDLPPVGYDRTEDDVITSVRPGLSRTRPAFRKAISMLAEAAPADERLADYYDRVTKRVKGDEADGENNPGAGVVKIVRRNNPGRTDATNVNTTPASDIPSQVAFQSLVAGAQGQSAEPRDPQSYSTGDDSQSGAEGGPSAQQQFTVGDMAFDTNPAIEQWMTYYTATPVGRRTMKIGIERSNSYLEMARAEFRSAGVPEDLVWLACVESVWNPRAVSPAAAGGIWQFMRATATEYGLKVQSGNDERADPFKQTRVAAAYLRDLYTIFGDWTLAMAAYNSGEPRVMGAIVRNGNANFWELYDKKLLPKETCNYVPKILATIRLASQAKDYGLAPQEEPAVYTGG